MSFLHFLWRLLPARQRRETLFSVMAMMAPRIEKAVPPAVGPYTVAGFFGSSSGLGEGARRASALQSEPCWQVEINSPSASTTALTWRVQYETELSMVLGPFMVV